ncbi:MAG: HEAT repeat domain-containing protein [Chthonomonadaceae bacterium]|nr:HEAT repeat domain-containing protein [Chthonomonadaceae bacterium]
MNVRRLRSLIASLKEGQTSLLWNVARELALMGSDAKEAIPALSALLTHEDPNSRLWAKFALTKITGETSATLPYFLAALRDNKMYYPGMVSTAVAGFGEEAVAALPLLIELLGDAEADNRWSSAWAIGAMGDAGKEAVPALMTALRDPDEKTRWYSAYALSEMSGDTISLAVDALIFAVEHDFDEDVRGYATRALGKSGEARAVSALLSLKEEQKEKQNDFLRLEAETALKRISSKI